MMRWLDQIELEDCLNLETPVSWTMLTGLGQAAEPDTCADQHAWLMELLTQSTAQ